MSFLFHSIAIPIWLLILLVAGLIPLVVQILDLIYRLTQGGQMVKEERSDMVVWKVRKPKKIAIPRQTLAEQAKQKRHDDKSDMLQILKAIAAKGEQGALLQTIADNVDLGSAKLQPALQSLIEKKFIDEITAVAGRRYSLTELGKAYCANKGIIE